MKIVNMRGNLVNIVIFEIAEIFGTTMAFEVNAVRMGTVNIILKPT